MPELLHKLKLPLLIGTLRYNLFSRSSATSAQYIAESNIFKKSSVQFAIVSLFKLAWYPCHQLCQIVLCQQTYYYSFVSFNNTLTYLIK